MNEEYFTEYPTHIAIPKGHWVSSHDVEYEVIEG